MLLFSFKVQGLKMHFFSPSFHDGASKHITADAFSDWNFEWVGPLIIDATEWK